MQPVGQSEGFGEDNDGEPPVTAEEGGTTWPGSAGWKAVPPELYRLGSRSPRALTPRAVDFDGISVTGSRQEAQSAGKRFWVVATVRFEHLEAVHSPPPDDHFVIRSRDRSRMGEWIDSRDSLGLASDQDDWHPLTRELFNSISGSDRELSP
jgi:hypothetical protein